jgi:hypothetical protein
MPPVSIGASISARRAAAPCLRPPRVSCRSPARSRRAGRQCRFRRPLVTRRRSCISDRSESSEARWWVRHPWSARSARAARWISQSLTCTSASASRATTRGTSIHCPCSRRLPTPVPPSQTSRMRPWRPRQRLRPRRTSLSPTPAVPSPLSRLRPRQSSWLSHPSQASSRLVRPRLFCLRTSLVGSTARSRTRPCGPRPLPGRPDSSGWRRSGAPRSRRPGASSVANARDRLQSPVICRGRVPAYGLRPPGA